MGLLGIPGLGNSERGLGALDPDWTSWETWWKYNQFAYIELERPRAVFPSTGDNSSAPGGEVGVSGLDRSAILRSLLAVQAEASDDRLQRASLIALARIGRALPELARELDVHAVLVDELDSPRRAISEAAVMSLGALGGIRASLTLSEILNDAEPARRALGTTRVPIRARSLAAYALGLASDGRASEAETFRAVHQLAAMLDEVDSRYEDLQTACVLGLGLVHLPELESEAELDASSSLTAPVEMLIGLLEDRRGRDAVRTHAPAAIARLVAHAPEALRERAARALLAHASRAHERDAAIRHSCLVALGSIGTAGSAKIDEAIREGLLDALRDGQAIERNFAAVALGQVGGRLGPDTEASLAGAREVATTLAKWLSRGKSQQRPWIGLALGVQGSGLAGSGVQLPAPVLAALSMRVEETRSPVNAVAFSLAAGLARSSSAQGAIEAEFGRVHDDQLRAQMALSLGLMGAASSRSLLGEEMDGARHAPQLMEQAALARRLLGDPTLVPHLLELLGQCDCWRSTSGVASALGWTGDARAVAPLLSLASDRKRSDAERAAAVIALGRLGGESPLPIARHLAQGVNYTAAPATLTDPTGFGVLDVL